MIETFIMESKCTEVPDGDAHERFLRYWHSCGALVASDGLLTRLRTLSPDLRDKYKLLLKYGWLASASDDWREINEFSDVKQLAATVSWPYMPTILFVSEVEGLYQDVDGNTRTFDTRERQALEVHGEGNTPRRIQLWHFGRADFRIGELCATNEDPIPARSEADVWNQRFAPLAQLSGRIVIVDRYALSRRNIDGLVNFVRHIDLLRHHAVKHDEHRRSVDLYVGFGGEQEVANYVDAHLQCEERIIRNNVICHGGIHDLRLFAVPDAEFAKIAHGRFVRFARNSGHLGWVVTMDTGIEAMNPHNDRPCDFAVKRLPTAVAPYQKAEEKLRRARRDHLARPQANKVSELLWSMPAS